MIPLQIGLNQQNFELESKSRSKTTQILREIQSDPGIRLDQISVRIPNQRRTLESSKKGYLHQGQESRLISLNECTNVAR